MGRRHRRAGHPPLRQPRPEMRPQPRRRLRRRLQLWLPPLLQLLRRQRERRLAKMNPRNYIRNDVSRLAAASEPSDWPAEHGRGAAHRWLPPSAQALLIQLVATAFVLMVVAPTMQLAAIAPTLFVLALVQGSLAAVLSVWRGLAPWWLPIQAAFAPGLVATLSLNLQPGWFLGAFLLMAVLYWSTFRTQVPLFLSNGKARDALAALLPAKRDFAFLDLGSGFGGLLASLSEARPDGRYYGIEAAPLPFAIGWLRVRRGRGNVRTSWGDFWLHSLAGYDVVYAYLSPVAMASLWAKARSEMRPGSLLISNSFIVPGVPPDQVVSLGDAKRSALYVWRI